jgi:hypothetical protein
MQDQPSPRDVAADFDRVEHSVLCLLLDPELPGPWSVDEVSRAIGNETEAVDALVSLHAAGLVHRCHEFVFPTRSAARLNRLVAGL